MHPILQDIVNKCSGLNILEKRHETETSIDLVLSTEDRDAINRTFEGIFGLPMKPTGKQPTPCDRFLTRKYGGIRSYQKLFAKKADSAAVTVLAMFRIWRYGTHMTVKLVVATQADLEAQGESWVEALKARVMGFLCKCSRSA